MNYRGGALDSIVAPSRSPAEFFDTLGQQRTFTVALMAHIKDGQAVEGLERV